MTTKVKPSELGGVPYRLTYSGQVFASAETRYLVTDYIRAYKDSVEHVVRYFLEVIDRRGSDELAAYILIGPSNVPQRIANTEVWPDVMGKESNYVTLKKGGDLKVIYTMAGHEVQTRVGEYLNNLIKQSDLGISDLNREKVEALFGFSPKLGARDTVAAAAFRILRSFLSSATNARKLIEDRELVFAAAMARGRLFSRGGVSHPVNRFFTVSRKGRHTTLTGFLVNAANKNGIAIQCGKAKPAFISSKDTVLTGQIPPQLHVVSAFHHLKKREFGYTPGGIAISKGRRDRLYEPITKSSSSFVLNASWSLLLYHFDEAFKAAADLALDRLEETMLVASEDLDTNSR
jgi:hypothetical protein